MTHAAWTAAAVAVAAILICGASAPAPATAAISADQAIAHLNAQRAANGIPGVVHAPALSDGCDKHNNYMAVNRLGLSHGEQPGRPGYTAEGAGIAPGSGGSEVLSAAGQTWDDAWANPWSTAPIHLLLMFSPFVQQAGYADSHGAACMRLTGFRSLPAASYSLPGNGATGVASIQTTRELPYTPAQLAGVSAATGYNILLWRPGATYDIAQATLTGPAGPVEVRAVDSRTSTPDGRGWRWGGAVLVPVRPLDADASYAVDVTFVDGGTHHSTFRTARLDPKLELRLFGSFDGKLTVYAPALAPLTAARIRGPGGREHPYTIDPAEHHRFSARGLRPGIYEVCVQAGGPGTGYSPVAFCDRAEVRATQAVSVRAVRGRRLRVTVGTASIAARRATLTLRNRSGRTLKVYRFRLVTRSFPRPKGTASFDLRAKTAGGYVPVSLSKRLR